MCAKFYPDRLRFGSTTAKNLFVSKNRAWAWSSIIQTHCYQTYTTNSEAPIVARRNGETTVCKKVSFGQYQIILLGGRGTCTRDRRACGRCVKTWRPAGETATYRSQVPGLNQCQSSDGNATGSALIWFSIPKTAYEVAENHSTKKTFS